MGIQSDLFSQQTCADQRQTAGFHKQNRQGAFIASHALEIKSLTDGLLRFVRSESFHKRGPKVIDPGRQAAKSKSVGSLIGGAKQWHQ